MGRTDKRPRHYLIGAHARHMELTPDEIEQAAELLCNSSGNAWAEQNENEKTGYRMIVTDLAAELDVVHSAAAVKVFMTWMGADE